MNAAQRVTHQDVDSALLRIERTIGPEEANLLRAYLSMLESQLRRYRQAQAPDETDLPRTCADCGSVLEAVRPGKWQCPNPQCESNHD